MKRLLKRLLPASLIDRYHLALARFAALRYGHPSRRMRVIGVTGTNGKSTVVNMIARVLEASGAKVGFTTTVNFGIAGREWLNDTKMTMLGRFRLQKLLADMVSEGCGYAIVETSSEGIKQHRHAGIEYDVAVFTNLTPEHIESHGGFENYKQAKGRLFAKLSRDPAKVLGGETVKKMSVVNLGDEYAPFFLSFRADRKYGFYVEKGDGAPAPNPAVWPIGIVKALDVRTGPDGSSFTVRGVPFRLAMPGRFNIENAMAAIAVGLSQGIALETMAEALGRLEGVPGRIERIDEGQPFTAIVDYAPEPESFRKLYEVVPSFGARRIIHVLGSTGGGRDVARRAVLGDLAAKNAAIVIVTNEDPYDDDPERIIQDVADGARKAGKVDGKDLFAVSDRGDAIDKAVSLAGPGDLILVTGKGAEQAMVVANGRKIPWDDRVRLREAIRRREAAGAAERVTPRI